MPASAHTATKRSRYAGAWAQSTRPGPGIWYPAAIAVACTCRAYSALAGALEFAAASAEQAWPHQLNVVLARWLRWCLALLLRVPAQTEGMAAFEARVRRAVTVTHRYRSVRRCGG